MTLYEMLDRTTYNQIVWIFKTNDYGENLEWFKGAVNDARKDDDVWSDLMTEVYQYEICDSILLIFFEEPDSSRSFSSEDSYLLSRDKRTWSYYSEIIQDVKAELSH